MAYEITLPRLGWDMVEGTLSGWIKQENEFVQAGDMLFAVEGDKAVQEIEAFDSGYLRLLPGGPQPGDKLPVGTLLGYLVPKAELESFHFPAEKSLEADLPDAGTSLSSVEPENDSPPALTPSRSNLSRRVYISPYARRLAQGLGVEWQAIKGTGLNGRIMAVDVKAAAEKHKAAPSSLPAAPVTPPVNDSSVPSGQPTLGEMRTPITSMRRKIAAHMAHSAHTSAPVTLTCEVDATGLVDLRKALKADAAVRELPVPSYNDLLAKLASQALLEHPLVNARLEGDEIVQSESVNIAVAVDTDRGLIVPVLHNVQAMSLRQVTRAFATLIEQTRSGSVSYADLQGATFTITNLGMFEIDAFTPIIDLPQCAILGVGRIVPKQVIVDAESEKLAIRQMMFLSLTFDHRLIDGAQAARFLQRIKRFVENPVLWLAGT